MFVRWESKKTCCDNSIYNKNKIFTRKVGRRSQLQSQPGSLSHGKGNTRRREGITLQTTRHV